MPRRHAFRYVKIQVISASLRFKVRFSKARAHAVTSAPWENPKPLSFSSNGGDIAAEDQELLRKIDEVSLQTLRNCMQTAYEDGPRRDMRLWIGDLRLQALCSYATFKDYDLAKRCLYLFAALPFDDEGLLCACVYEKPKPKFGGNSIGEYLGQSHRVDYADSTLIIASQRIMLCCLLLLCSSMSRLQAIDKRPWTCTQSPRSSSRSLQPILRAICNTRSQRGIW